MATLATPRPNCTGVATVNANTRHIVAKRDFSLGGFFLVIARDAKPSFIRLDGLFASRTSGTSFMRAFNESLIAEIA